MKCEFNIFVDRLRDGKEEVISEEFPPDFLDVLEEDLSFPSAIKVNGKAYVVDKDLVLQLEAITLVMQPCRVCNEHILHTINSQICHVEPHSEIKGMVFDFQNVLRENLLLEIPSFIECDKGKCGKRQEISKYLVGKKGKATLEEEFHQPFKNLL